MIVKYMGQRTLGGWVAIAICLTIISARTECEEFGCVNVCGESIDVLAWWENIAIETKQL